MEKRGGGRPGVRCAEGLALGTVDQPVANPWEPR